MSSRLWLVDCICCSQVSVALGICNKPLHIVFSFPDVFDHENDDGEGVEHEHEEDVQVGVAAVVGDVSPWRLLSGCAEFALPTKDLPIGQSNSLYLFG